MEGIVVDTELGCHRSDEVSPKRILGILEGIEPGECDLAPLVKMTLAFQMAPNQVANAALA